MTLASISNVRDDNRFSNYKLLPSFLKKQMVENRKHGIIIRSSLHLMLSSHSSMNGSYMLFHWDMV